MLASPLPAALGGDRALPQAPDSADLRRQFWDSRLNLPLNQARLADESIVSNAWGRWKMQRRIMEGFIYTIISPEKNSAWPVYTQGSWIFKRNASNGRWVQIKIYLRSDPELFIRLYPDERASQARTKFDVLAYGAVLYQEITLPLPFERVALLSLNDIIAMSQDSVDWQLFSPQVSLYSDMRQLIEQVRRHLPSLRYADDGAIDQNGQAVYISSLRRQTGLPGLNCSGFLKWLVDGLLYSVTGQYLSVAHLRQRMPEVRGSGFTESWEEIYDPYFGLDWSRALAAAAWNSLFRRESSSPLAHDVAEPGFSLMADNLDPIVGGEGYSIFPAPQETAGVHISGLKAYLFLLANREPGKMYFAQFNARDTVTPVLRRYFHVAALLPYFDEEGIFRIVVFESAAETSFERLLDNPRYEFVQLVRMPVLRNFTPPILPER